MSYLRYAHRHPISTSPDENRADIQLEHRQYDIVSESATWKCVCCCVIEQTVGNSVGARSTRRSIEYQFGNFVNFKASKRIVLSVGSGSVECWNAHQNVDHPDDGAERSLWLWHQCQLPTANSTQFHFDSAHSLTRQSAYGQQWWGPSFQTIRGYVSGPVTPTVPSDEHLAPHLSNKQTHTFIDLPAIIFLDFFRLIALEWHS